MKSRSLLAILSMVIFPLVSNGEEIKLMYYRGGSPASLKRDLTLTHSPLERARTIVEAMLKTPYKKFGLTSYIPEGASLYDLKVDKKRITIILRCNTLPPPTEVVVYDEMQRQIINTLSPHLKEIEIYDLRFYKDGKIITIDEATRSKREIEIKSHDGCNILKLNSRDAAPGTLSKKRIVVSPGHGFYYNDTIGWTTQRGSINGLIEDLLTADICNNWLIPYLEHAGAHVISVRERDFSTEEYIMDNSSPQGYREVGIFTDGNSPGGYAGSYRVSQTDTQQISSIAEYTINIANSSFFRVSLWWVPGTNRADDTQFLVIHSGGETEFLIDQRLGTPTWFYLPTFYFFEKGVFQFSNKSSKENAYIIADAIRLGGGMGSISRGGSTSGRPRWQEAARYFIQYAGAASSIYDALTADNNDDVVARPKYADWAEADLYISVHTNAFDNSSTGTETYYYNGQIYPGSNELASTIQSQIIEDIRKEYDPEWTDRGVKSANFGELRECKTMPSTLIELAFHDGTKVKDNAYLHDTKFKKLMGRAIYRGIAKFINGTNRFLPEPPVEIYAESPIVGVLKVSWAPVENASYYKVYLSRDGYGYDNGTTVSQTSFQLRCLKPGLLFVKLTSVNEGGESLDSEVLAVTIRDIRDWEPILIVNAFDRLDSTVEIDMNRGNWIIPHARALYKNGYFFESATNEAFAGDVDLSRYTMIDWINGLESTVDETLSRKEQNKMINFLLGGGSLFISGSEIAWDLDFKGDIDDKRFFNDWIRAEYSSDSAGVYRVIPAEDGIFNGINEILFDNGSHGTYPVKYPDVITPVNNAKIELLYEQNKGVAGTSYSGVYKLIYFGFPFESIYDADKREEVIRRISGFMVGDPPDTNREVEYTCCNPGERVCIDSNRYRQCALSGTYSEIKRCDADMICQDGACIENQNSDAGIDITRPDVSSDASADISDTTEKEDLLTANTYICNNGDRICDGNNVKVCVRNEWYIGSVCGAGTACINGICVSAEIVDSGLIVESDSSGCGCSLVE